MAITKKKGPRRRIGGGRKRLVFCMSFRHHRSGKIVRSKTGRPFAFWVDAA
jgi:hypothetical protein